MARGNLFLGKARGKVGSVVFSRDKFTGQMITRAYQSQVSNPKTASQVVQRAIFATCSTAGSILGDIVDHSFDGVAEGQACRNEFVRVNSRSMGAQAVLEGAESINRNIKPKGAAYIQPYQYQISRGNLGTIFLNSPIMGHIPASANFSVSCSTFRSWFPMLSPGGQLTFIGLYEDTTSAPERSYVVSKCRLVFNDLLWASDDGVVMTSNGFFASFLDLTKIEGLREISVSGSTFWASDVVELKGDGPEADFKFASSNEYGQSNPPGLLVGWAVIATRYDATKSDPWVHSTSIMSINYDAWDDTNDNIATYGASNVNKIKSSEYYLDAAEPGGERIEIVTLEEIVSGIVGAAGMKEVGVYVGKTFSYGPVAEGAIVQFTFTVPTGFRMLNVTAYNGETPLSNDWRIGLAANGTILSISGPMPTTTSFAANISFDVYSLLNSSDVGRAAIRGSISKANS